MKSASADHQFPDSCEAPLRILIITQSTAAPEKMRTRVKVAASMLVRFSAARQSSELLANAIIASSVRVKTRVFMEITTQKSPISGIGVELRFAGRNFLVSTFGADVVSKPTNTSLSDDKLSTRELERDLAFVFGPFGFEDCGVALNARNAAALAFICRRTLRRLVFVGPGEFDLKPLLAKRPNFEFAAFHFPGAVDLGRGNVA